MPPNVLIICVDEMRADHLGCMGNGMVRTPNLDRLAARGTLLRRSYCNNPICMPARVGMFTGLLPRDHGVRVNGQTMHPDLPVLPELLASAGYRTHAAGKLHLTPWVPKAPDSQVACYPECLDFWGRGLIGEFPRPFFGFQTVDFVGGHTAYAYGDYSRWLRERGGDPADLRPAADRYLPAGQVYRMAIPEELHYNRYIADSAIGLIEEAAEAPFFCWCSFPDPHAPVAAPERYLQMYDPAAIPLPPCREGEIDDLPPVYRQVMAGEVRPNGIDNRGMFAAAWREFIAGTYAMVTHLDHEIGRVMDALDRSGRAADTLVVFLADHGDMMGDHGLQLKSFYTFAGCIRIPTIIAAPDGVAGCVSDALVAQVDLLPSVLDYCGVPLSGGDWATETDAYERGAVQPLQLYPGRSWRPLVTGAAERIRDDVVIENDDPTTGFRVRCLVTPTHRLTVYPGTPDGELFDIEADPDELHNLWCTQPELRQQLIARLLDAYSLATPMAPVPPANA